MGLELGVRTCTFIYGIFNCALVMLGCLLLSLLWYAAINVQAYLDREYINSIGKIGMDDREHIEKSKIGQPERL